jgi:hypothetical protein
MQLQIYTDGADRLREESITDFRRSLCYAIFPLVLGGIIPRQAATVGQISANHVLLAGIPRFVSTLSAIIETSPAQEHLCRMARHCTSTATPMHNLASQWSSDRSDSGVGHGHFVHLQPVLSVLGLQVGPVQGCIARSPECQFGHEAIPYITAACPHSVCFPNSCLSHCDHPSQYTLSGNRSTCQIHTFFVLFSFLLLSLVVYLWKRKRARPMDVCQPCPP